MYLYNNGIDPYSGDIFHENPFVLKAACILLNNFADFSWLIFIVIDLLTAIFIYFGTKSISRKNVSL